MINYITNLENYLNSVYANGKKVVGVNESDLYLIHVFGYNEKHSFSVKLSKNTISFYGYDSEADYDLNEQNFEEIKGLIELAINHGTRLDISYKENKTEYSYELISKEKLSVADVERLYSEMRQKSGKAIVPCHIECSNFLGTNIVNVEI